MSRRHASPLRGLETARHSAAFEGRFGRLFRTLPAATFGRGEDGHKSLDVLAQTMTAGFEQPFDGPDDEESGIPALFTYFGQFIDHDLTFDPASSLQKQNDPDALVDYRTPAFDLDCLYGRGPGDQPYLYEEAQVQRETEQFYFLLGNDLRGGHGGAHDLPRNGAKPARALIGDPRNDENVIVSQLHGLFLRFHNRFVTEHPNLSFAEVQQQLRFHYQYVVLNDFLPRIVTADVLESLKTAGQFDERDLRLYHFRNDPFMPVEFSVAAYRFGHSMVRPGYRLNDATIQATFPVKEQGHEEGLTGLRAMNPNWGIDWGRFIDIDQRADGGEGSKHEKENKLRLQFAYKIDTSLAHPLGVLPLNVVGAPPHSLPFRNLKRGVSQGLPSGQAVADALGERRLDDEQIHFEIEVAPEKVEKRNIAQLGTRAFEKNCPLWTYVLAEAMQNVSKVAGKDTPQLGPVGGRIVAEVFLGLMFGDPNSLLSLHPGWVPEIAGKPARGYGLKDFVKYALGL